MNLYQLFRKNIETYQLISENDQIIAAFSGGKDSTVLILLLKELQKEIPFSLQAAYFNHQIRKDAPAEEEWVENFCNRHKIELFKGRRNVRQYSLKNNINLEDAASKSRYEFFNQLLKRFPQAKIATAHTRSDLVETFFIKLFRGSGLQGLSGIFQKKYQKIIRPLLTFSQEHILCYLKDNQIDYYQDATNLETAFLRNRIRLQLIPEIKKIEPQIELQVFKTVDILQQEFEFFSETAQKILKKNLILNQVLKLKIFENRHLALQRHIVREYLRLLKGNLLNISYLHIQQFLEAKESKKGLSLPGLNIVFSKGYAYKDDFHIPSYSYCWSDLSTPLLIKETETVIFAETVSGFFKPADNSYIIVEKSKLRLPLTVRSFNPEDRFQKINTSFQQRASEVIREAGFPDALKPLAALLINGDGEIIWIRGAPVGEKFKIKEKVSGTLIKFSFTDMEVK